MTPTHSYPLDIRGSPSAPNTAPNRVSQSGSWDNRNGNTHINHQNHESIRNSDAKVVDLLLGVGSWAVCPSGCSCQQLAPSENRVCVMASGAEQNITAD